MAASSRFKGYLAPTDSSPEGADLDDALARFVVGVTGLPGEMVRPRWQPEPPSMPALGETWCAIGVTRRRSDLTANVRHKPAGAGADEVRKSEFVECLASFYGPQADRMAGYLRDGFNVEQNRAELAEEGLALYEAQEAVRLPDLVNERWRERIDVAFTLRRAMVRVYPVRNILAARADLQTDTALPVQTVIVEQ